MRALAPRGGRPPSAASVAQPGPVRRGCERACLPRARVRASVRGEARPRPQVAVVFPGAGLLFWWQVGVAQYLLDHFDLRASRCAIAGASAGALAAALLASGVDSRRAASEALALSREANVWERPLGLVGVWGGLIRAWLDALLPRPSGASTRVDVGVDLGVFTVRLGTATDSGDRAWAVVHSSLRLASSADDEDVPGEGWVREELLATLLASVHVPLVLDGRACAEVGGVGGFVDGSLGLTHDKAVRCLQGAWGEGVEVVWVDHTEDAGVIRERARGGATWRAQVPLLSLDDTLGMGEETDGQAHREPWEATWAWVETKMDQGWAHAHELDRQGRFKRLQRRTRPIHLWNP